MEAITIKGNKREILGKQNSKQLRREAYVPCVLYGGKEQIHFFLHMSYIKNIIYTSKVYFINIDIEGKTYKTILQDTQFHPVSDIVIHMDFLQIFDDKKINIQIPISCVGESPGVLKGGLVSKKLRKLKVNGLPKNLPSKIPVDISKLDLGNSAKVRDISTGDYEIIMPKTTPVVSIIVPRALRSKQDDKEEKNESSSKKSDDVKK